MCDCKNWCRDWQETQGGKYPKADHAPGCEDYKTERFVRLEHGGTACIMEPKEAYAMIEESDSETAAEYSASYVFLTRDQFERMPEFNGF